MRRDHYGMSHLYCKIGGGVYWGETTHQNRPKRPTLKSGRNDLVETTHGRNHSCSKRPKAETIRTSMKSCIPKVRLNFKHVHTFCKNVEHVVENVKKTSNFEK